MNLSESIGIERMQSKAKAWWASKSKDEQIEIETHVAIAAPKLGGILGMLLVFLIP